MQLRNFEEGKEGIIMEYPSSDWEYEESVIYKK